MRGQEAKGAGWQSRGSRLGLNGLPCHIDEEQMRKCTNALSGRAVGLLGHHLDGAGLLEDANKVA